MSDRSMFDNYEKTRKKAQPKKPDIFGRYWDDRLVGSANAQIIKDINGKEIGIRAPEGSNFTIYFTFNGTAEDMTIEELLAEAVVGCEILNKRHQIIIEPTVTLDANNAMAYINLTSEHDGTLCYGNYYIRLYMLLDGLEYTLFSEQDGVISIE